MRAPARPPATLELYWIPLGAGTRVVRFSGRCYERVVAARQRRAPAALYHAALVADTADGRVTLEVAPTPDRFGRDRRGVVGAGPVGSRRLGRWRWFRYEVRCWAGGAIPDLDAAAALQRVSTDAGEITAVLAAAAAVPTPTWGRDEIGAGDMWNSNSVVAWVLAEAGLLDRVGGPPPGGRAPGWHAGAVAAERQLVRSTAR